MMKEFFPVLITTIIVMNIVSFCAYGIDKRRAKRGKWRIPEATLLLLTFLFGGFGGVLGMRVFRHKTKHKKFIILVPAALVIQTIIISLAGSYL